jgi:hypothetical protein
MDQYVVIFSFADLHHMPIIVAARSKARTGFAHSNTRAVVSNPTGGMDVCVRLFCIWLFCVYVEAL